MMTTLLAGLLLSACAPKIAEPTITGATFYRNGYGFVATEAPLDPTGTSYVKAPPQAVEGTLWFAPGKGARIREVTMTWIESDAIDEKAGSIPEILALNVGKKVTMDVTLEQDKTELVTGTILSINRGQIMLQLEGSIRSINLYSVVSLHGKYDDFSTTARTNVRIPVMKVISDPGTGGTITTISLVQGVNWVPAYEIELKDDSKMSMSMKATITNSLGDFKSVDVGLMSGFPKIDSINDTDPFTSNLEAILEASQDMTRIALVRGANTYGGGMSGGFGMGGGGFGGSGGDASVPGGITRVSYDPTDSSLVRGADRKNVQDLGRNFGSEERENFFIYGIPKFELNRGERKYMVIDEGEFDYQLVHKAMTSSSMAPVSVQRFASFTNQLNVPLTRASVILRRDEELIGKTLMPYAYMKDKVELSLGEAPYVKASSMTVVTDRARGKLKLRDGRTFDEITRRDTISARNLSARPIGFSLTHSVRGDNVKTTPEGIVIRLTTQDSVNFDHSINWTVTIAPGETKTFAIEYATFTPVPDGGS